MASCLNTFVFCFVLFFLILYVTFQPPSPCACLNSICRFRGQESAGIVTSFGQDVYQMAQHKGMGLVGQVFKEENILKPLKGNLGIGEYNCKTLHLLNL